MRILFATARSRVRRNPILSNIPIWRRYMSHPKVLIFFANIFPYWEEELAIAQDTGGEGGGGVDKEYCSRCGFSITLNY